MLRCVLFSYRYTDIVSHNFSDQFFVQIFLIPFLKFFKGFSKNNIEKAVSLRDITQGHGIIISDGLGIPDVKNEPKY